jgi:hypothetical protein
MESVAGVRALAGGQHQQHIHVLAAQEQGLVVPLGVVVQLEELYKVEADVKVCKRGRQTHRCT